MRVSSCQSLAPPRSSSPSDVLWCCVDLGAVGMSPLGHLSTSCWVFPGPQVLVVLAPRAALGLGKKCLESCFSELRDEPWPFGKVLLENCHIQVMHQAQEVKASGRASGGGAEGTTCLKNIPEKLAFACFAFHQHSHIHAGEWGEWVRKGPPVPREPRAAPSSCLEEERGTHWLKTKSFPWL